jgi:pSer/pThr/pTyr-binding forkhead associated (FHA) protein
VKVKLIIANSNSKEGEFEKVIPPELEIATIGRHPSSYLHLNSAHISKEHALIIRQYDNFYLVDKSTNGTLLNYVRVEREKRNQLKNGDLISVAEFRITFALEEEHIGAQAMGMGVPEVASPQSQMAPSYDLYSQDPLSDPSLDPGDTVASFTPTRFEDVIRNMEPGEESSYLVFVGGARDGQRVELRGSTSEIFIGRGPNCQVQIAHQSIAATHAKIRMDWAGITVYDLNSQSGVFINGVRINSSRKLHNGDEISFGIPVSQGGVKLILYDRNSISGDSWVGLPPPVTIENTEKVEEKPAEKSASPDLKEPQATAAGEPKSIPPAAPEGAQSSDSIEEIPAPRSILDLNYVIYGGVTIREALVILFLIIVVLIFSAIALSLVGI